MKRLVLNNVEFDYLMHTYKTGSIKEDILNFLFRKNKNEEHYFHVLRNISFSLKSGDRLCIIGKNGAGKSTLLRILAGIYQPTSGKIEINGNVSCMIEIGAGMDPELTGRENIYFMGMITGFTKKEIASLEQEIIEFADIGDFIDTPVKYYSTGMAGRLGFSVSTSIHPDILIADELFAGGDINFITKATKRLEEMKERADIFVAVSHNLDYIMGNFNKILYLKDNSIVYFGDDIQQCIDSYLNDSKPKE